MTDLEMFKKVLGIIKCELEETTIADGTKIDIWSEEHYVGTAYFKNDGSCFDFCNWYDLFEQTEEKGKSLDN